MILELEARECKTFEELKVIVIKIAEEVDRINGGI